MTTPTHSFPPTANTSASTLILGSIPGKASISENQYYAHPRNAFWPIMGNIYHFDATLSYEERVTAIKASNIAVWDVLAQCIRPGSLDSAIKKGSRIANNFSAFFDQHPNIQLIGFNGAEAESSFMRYVFPDIKQQGIKRIRLPSTSPAYTMPIENKILAWRSALSL